MADSSNNCQSPLQYFTCNSNGFKGCCSVDPCDSLGCPEQNDGSEPIAAASTSDATPSSSSEPASTPSPAVHSDAASSIKQVFADPDPTSSSSSFNPYEAATLLVPPKSATSATSTDSSSLVLITSVVFASPEIVTPTSNGIALAPTSSMVTFTGLLSISTPMRAVTTLASATSSAAVLPSASTTLSSSTHSHSTTPVVAGSVGGVAGVVVAALLIWLLLRWQRLRRAKEMRKAQLDDDPRLQGIDAHRAGSAFKDDDGRPPYGMKADAAGTDRTPHSASRSTPVSPLSPMYRTSMTTTSTHQSPPRDSRSPEMEGLLSGSTNRHTELSGGPAPSISELSPNAERSAINTPRRAAVPAPVHVDAGQIQGAGSLMRPNLDQSEPSPTSDGPEADHQKHVMSWMDYDGANPSPAR